MDKEDKYELVALFIWILMVGLVNHGIAKASNNDIWVVLAGGLFQFWAAWKMGTAVGRNSVKRSRERRTRQ